MSVREFEESLMQSRSFQRTTNDLNHISFCIDSRRKGEKIFANIRDTHQIDANGEDDFYFMFTNFYRITFSLLLIMIGFIWIYVFLKVTLSVHEVKNSGDNV